MCSYLPPNPFLFKFYSLLISQSTLEKEHMCVLCVEDVPCSHLPARCMWSGCCLQLWSQCRWSPAAAQPSSGCQKPGPCRRCCSCSGRWCSGKRLWTAASRKSTGCWRCCLAGYHQHSWTVKNTSQKRNLVTDKARWMCCNTNGNGSHTFGHN